MGGLAATRGDHQRAARLYAAVLPLDRASHERSIARIRHSLGEEAFAAA